MRFRNLFQSRMSVAGMILLGVLLVAVGIFRIAEFVRYRSVSFSSRWTGYGHRVFVSSGGLLGSLPGHGMIRGHSALGSVARIDGSSVAIKTRDGGEKIITVSLATVIRRSNQVIALADLRLGDRIAVVGSPEISGAIDAKFIRVFR